MPYDTSRRSSHPVGQLRPVPPDPVPLDPVPPDAHPRLPADIEPLVGVERGTDQLAATSGTELVRGVPRLSRQPANEVDH